MTKKKEKGITLIALVVTIVVLLILAGISISMLTGENGVIAQANNSAIKTDNGTVLENIRLKVTEYETRINGEKVTNRLEQLKIDGIIDEQGVVNCKTLIGQKLKTGNGNNYKDVYVIEENELYYYDKKCNKNYLGDIGSDEEIYDEADTSLFNITDDGVISIKKEYGYYSNGSGYWDSWTLEELVIPSEVNGITVTSITDYFIGANEKIKKVYLSDSIIKIEKGAFERCSSLTSITIPNSVTSIGYNAFRYCGSLTSITIPDSVTSIVGCAFEGCRSLTSITIPDSVTSIRTHAFCGCSSLTSITIPDSVTSIDYYAFYDCSSLTTVNYTGTEEQWNKISINSSGNDCLTNATKNYNYTGE